jgi:putative transposase
MPNYRRHFQPGQTVFLTIVTAGRRRWMATPAAKAHVLRTMSRTHAFHPFRHVAHVILDEHLHWLLAPRHTTRVPKLVASFKRDLSLHRGPVEAQGALWQARYYDHVVRDKDDLRRHLDYVHFNPVKHGYARSAGEYRWSSFLHWVRRGWYAPDWGCSRPEGIDGMDLD